MYYHSVIGGTGSGLGDRVAEALSVDYGKKPKMTYTVWPSPRLSTCVVENYNAALCSNFLLEHVDLAMMLDNEQLYKVCSNQMGIEDPKYADINRLIAQHASSMFATMRFGGSINSDMNDILTRTIPYPRQHFLIPSIANLQSEDKEHQDSQSVTKLGE